MSCTSFVHHLFVSSMHRTQHCCRNLSPVLTNQQSTTKLCYSSVRLTEFYTFKTLHCLFWTSIIFHSIKKMWKSLSLSLSLSLCVCVSSAIFQAEPGLAGLVDSKDDGSGGDNWTYKTCKASVKLSLPTNQQWAFYRPDALRVTQPTRPKYWRDTLQYETV